MLNLRDYISKKIKDFSLYFLEVFLLFTHLHLFNVKMYRKETIHAYVVFDTFLKKKFPGCGPKFLSQN